MIAPHFDFDASECEVCHAYLADYPDQQGRVNRCGEVTGRPDMCVECCTGPECVARRLERYCSEDEDCVLAPSHAGQHVDDQGREIVRCVRCGWIRQEDERETYCGYETPHSYPAVRATVYDDFDAEDDRVSSSVRAALPLEGSLVRCTQCRRITDNYITHYKAGPRCADYFACSRRMDVAAIRSKP